jgi:anaerobic selenocysteine-containing dehydrogenase
MSSDLSAVRKWPYGAAGILPGEKHAAIPLFTPHLQYGLHSQFVNLDWMQVFWPEPFVYMHPIAAEKRDCRKRPGESV